MAKKTLRSAAGAAEGQLKAGAKRIRGQLAPVEKAAEKLATKAKERLPSPADVKAELPGVGRKLKEATASVTKRKGTAKGAAAQPSSSPQAAPAAPADGGGPDDSWTVADLRAEAKKRGVTGYSRMTKGELLAALRR
jgi:lysophospholipase